MKVLTWLLCPLLCGSLQAQGQVVPLKDVAEQLHGQSPEEICKTLSAYKQELSEEGDVYIFAKSALELEELQLGDDETVALLQCLVQMKISLKDEPFTRETLLFPAVNKKRIKTVEYLVARGVVVWQRSMVDCSSAAENAIEVACLACLEKLFGGGPNNKLDPNEENPDRCTAQREKAGRCRAGWALAHFAAMEDDPSALKLLQEKGADLNKTNKQDFAPVQVAVRYMSNQALTELGKLGASFDVVTAEGETLAHLACKFPGSDPVSPKVKMCLETIKKNGGRLSATNDQHQTPAHVCSSTKNADNSANLLALQFLYNNARASFEEKDDLQRTPRQVAVAEHNIPFFFYANIRAQKEAERSANIAEKARREAERFAELAEKARHEAEKSQEKISDRAEKEQTVRKKCEDLSLLVDQLMDCNIEEGSLLENISVPRGSMIPNSRWCTDGKGPCAMRCLNFDACPEVRESRQNQCDKRYDSNSPGCSRCAKGHGRQRQDPFRCNECGPRWRGWLAYLAKPLGIYAVSLWTAQKEKKKKYLGSLLKIWLAFGVIVASISPIIGSTKTVKFLMGAVQTGAASIGSPISGGSYDCLLDTNQSSSISAWFSLAVAPALVLWCASVIALVVRWFVNARTMCLDATDVEGLMKDNLKISIVVMNCFLPDLAAALVRFFPCVHFQTDDKLPVKPRFLQFNVETNCAAVLPMRVTTLGLAFFICFLLGPAYWIRVIWKSEKWEDRETILGFLISGYRPEVCWWETTVLLRKCSVAAAVAMFSSSYAPMLYLSSLLFIVGIGLACHAYMQPYEDPFLNRLEFGTLLASFVAVFCTFLLQLESHSWATDKAVTIPALLTMSIAVVVPFLGLIILYFREIRLEDLRAMYDKVRPALNRISSLIARMPRARQRTAQVELIPLR